MLAAKPQADQALAAQMLPEDDLGRRHLAAECPGESFRPRGAVHVMILFMLCSRPQAASPRPGRRTEALSEGEVNRSGGLSEQRQSSDLGALQRTPSTA